MIIIIRTYKKNKYHSFTSSYMVFNNFNKWNVFIAMKVLLEDWHLIHIIELIYSVFENKEKDCSIFMFLFVNWSFLDPKYPVLKFAVPSWTLHNIDKNIPIQRAFNVHVHTSNVKQILIHDTNTFASFSQVYLLCIIIHVAF